MNTHHFEPSERSIEAKKRKNQAERTQRISEISTPTQNASQTGNITPSPLQNLPGELIEKIALFMADEDLRHFRMTSRSAQSYTAEEFAVRHLTEMRFQLNEEDLRATLDILRYEDLAKHISRVKIESFSAYIALTPTEEDLLDQILTKMTTATHLEITDEDRYFTRRGPRPAPATSHLLRALCNNPLPNITSLAITRANVTRPDLQRLLTIYSTSLTAMKLEEVYCARIDWANILAFARDKLPHLEILTFRCLRGNSGGKILDLSRNRPIQKFLRNPATMKIEQYVMNSDKAEMSGRLAITLGLNRMLQLEGSELYDGSIMQ
ncbi:hypothetical protein AC578_5185 [Pseudocercospora eumusae]|uniref:F-box domain-containing protein n=1 Tax=Pseudocercospora eumusae TaxID=321146 RepID=A0A139HMG2_9PEZI|nr:hypothetical protein AC578_5185 [Pseudocercospora eumusae]